MDNPIIIVVYICILILNALCIARKTARISITISTVRQHFHFCDIVEINYHHARGIVYWASRAPTSLLSVTVAKRNGQRLPFYLTLWTCTNQCLIALRATPKPLCGRAQRDRALVSATLNCLAGERTLRARKGTHTMWQASLVRHC